MSAFRKFDLKQEPIALEFIPTGIRGLDQLFGGGLPHNHLILIEEDEFNVYSNLLLRAVSSNVIHDKVNLTYFSDKISSDPSVLIKKLPSRTKLDSKSIDSPKDMQIAFRYNYMPSLDNETGFIMDFGRLLEEKNFKSQVNIDSIAIHPIKDVLSVMEKYTKSQVSSHSLNNASASKSRHLIILDHISACTSSLSSDSICGFIHQLKSFARQLTKFTILVSIQSGWLSNVIIKRLRNISDTSIQLEAFDPLQPSAYSDDYKGALHVHKVTRVSSSKDSLVADLGFQLKKNNRYFIIEKLFLPPDIGDTPSRVPTKSNTADDIF